MAEKAFVRFEDYQAAPSFDAMIFAQGIQLVKRLRLLDDRVKQKAEARCPTSGGLRTRPGGRLLPAL